MTAPEPFVLIVDDDVDVRESLTEILQDHGYTAVAASNGREALERLHASPALPCVILLDLMMPVMDGRQFRVLQMQDAQLERIPVLILSAQTNMLETVQDLKAMASLKKPIDLRALLSAIERLCPRLPQ
jgi:CheY-like chemotaxis protein